MRRCLADPGLGPTFHGVISYVFIDGFTRVRRDEAIERLKRAIADADGVILDFAFFASDAIRLTVELEAGALVDFGRTLEAAEVELSPPCLAEMAHARTMATTHAIYAMIHVSFLPAEAALERPEERQRSGI